MVLHQARDTVKKWLAKACGNRVAKAKQEFEKAIEALALRQGGTKNGTLWHAGIAQTWASVVDPLPYTSRTKMSPSPVSWTNYAQTRRKSRALTCKSPERRFGCEADVAQQREPRDSRNDDDMICLFHSRSLHRGSINGNVVAQTVAATASRHSLRHALAS